MTSYYRDVPVICCTNAGYMDYTLNFVKFVQRLQPLPWTLHIYCMDQASFEQCSVFRDVQAHYLPFEGGSEAFQQWGQVAYKRICYYRYDVIRKLFAEGVPLVIHLDTDMALLNDPVDFMVDFMTKAHPEAPWAGQCDENRLQCSNPERCANLCGGCFIIRNCPVTQKIIAKESYAPFMDRLSGDQEYFNRVLEHLGAPKRSLPCELFMHPPKKALLDRSKTMLYHFNYIIGHAKQARMKSEGYWLEYVKVTTCRPSPAPNPTLQ